MEDQPKEIDHCHEEIANQETSKTGYTGDTVTETSYQSPAERSLVWKIGSLFATLAALIYFVAYLVRVNLASLQKQFTC